MNCINKYINSNNYNRIGNNIIINKKDIKLVYLCCVLGVKFNYILNLEMVYGCYLWFNYGYVWFINCMY